MDTLFDRQHIWHPYTDMANPDSIWPVVSADKCSITLADGRELIDGMSSWWTAIHGYNHPVLNAAIVEQTSKMSHVMFGGLTHQPAIELAKQLVEITADPLDYVFFADSGSVAVEAAMKMAAQHSFAKGQTKKKKFLTFRKGYHGDTFGAMSVCDPVDGMHQAFKPLLHEHIFIDSPSCGFEGPWSSEYIKEVESVLSERHQEIIAFICEPIVQNAGGMNFYSAEYLRQIRTLCDRYGVLLIFDEIATGFGRTGLMFAYEHANVCPDILCLGKSLTAGMMTLSAVLCNKRIAYGIDSRFMHGPTYMANPLACAVASASIRLLQNSKWQTQVKAIEEQMQINLAPCASHPAVKEVRVLGAIGVVELRKALHVDSYAAFFVEQGVWIRPFRNLIYLMPPYIISPDQLSQLCHSIYLSLQELT